MRLQLCVEKPGKACAQEFDFTKEFDYSTKGFLPIALAGFAAQKT